RKPNPWFTRGTSTSSQSAQPLADYCAKTLKYKRMLTIADDIAYGHEMCAGFQRVFEDAGCKIVQKLFPPLTVPDYGTYIAQLKTNVDGIFLGFAGSNGFRFYRQFNEYGLRGKVAVVGGMTAFDEAVLRNMGDEALGIITSCWYSADVENAINKRFVANFRVDWGYDPGFYAAATYVEAAVLDATLQRIHGKIEDKQAFMKTVRAITVDTARGPVRFDHLGNVVGTILKFVPSLWLAALIGGAVIAIFGGLIERFILRALAGNALGQVLVTLGISFIVADFCLIVWGGDPIPVQTPLALQQPLR